MVSIIAIKIINNMVSSGIMTIYYASTRNEESFDRLLIKQLMKRYDVISNIYSKIAQSNIFGYIDKCDIFICNITDCQPPPENEINYPDTCQDVVPIYVQIYPPPLVSQYNYAVAKGKIIICVENVMGIFYDESIQNNFTISSNGNIIRYANIYGGYENECAYECKEDNHFCINGEQLASLYECVDITYNELIKTLW
jgi:hypothetical protein